MPIRDLDKGLKATMAALAGKATLTVGVHAAEGSAPAEGGAATVADVATWNEFGTDRIPARSFIRAWAEEKAAENKALIKAAAEKAVKGEALISSLERVGVRMVGSIQKRMSGGIPPPNADSTIQRKGSSKPLVDTGQLKASITYQIKAG